MIHSSFLMFTFGSDYLREKFIAFDNCTLLATNLAKSIPRIFFTRDLSMDCPCDILVIEVLKSEAPTNYVKTQKLAKTVLLTSSPLSSLEAFLKLGNLDYSLVYMRRKAVLFSVPCLWSSSDEESVLQSFAKAFDVEECYNLDNYRRLSSVNVLKKGSWLVGPLRKSPKSNDSYLQAEPWDSQGQNESSRSVESSPDTKRDAVVDYSSQNTDSVWQGILDDEMLIRKNPSETYSFKTHRRYFKGDSKITLCPEFDETISTETADTLNQSMLHDLDGHFYVFGEGNMYKVHNQRHRVRTFPVKSKKESSARSKNGSKKMKYR